jgi:predicted transcriptional regulator
MSKAVILSIHPKWAEKIYSGEKTIEWRTSFPKDFISFQTKVYLYETAPVKKITGVFFLESVLYLTTACFEKGISQAHIENGCVPLEDLKKYKGNSGCLYGWRVALPCKRNPRELTDFGLQRAPQSWQYVEVMDR